MEAPEKKSVEARTVISLQHRGSYDEIGKVYRELRHWASQNNVSVKGDGLTVFLSPPSEFDPRSSVFEVCTPVESAPEGDAKIIVQRLPSCTVACVTVKGPYEQIPAHYTEMLAWLSIEGWEIVGPPREVYIKRPDAEGGGKPEELVTEIQFPIKQ